jgi:hypothetical protein
MTRVDQGLREVEDACCIACDFVFNVARGTPRQGVLRAALDAQRKKRAAELDRVTSRATHKHT